MTLSNKAGDCDSSARLTVVKRNLLKVLDSLKDAEVSEGEPIKLSVKVEGQPNTVKWLKNGQEMKPDGRVQIVSFCKTKCLIRFPVHSKFSISLASKHSKA